MGFNYAREKLRFDAEWKALATQYGEAGMDEAGIQAMHEFDWEWFRQRRTYENRNQTLPSEIMENNEDESHSTLFLKYSSLTTSFSEDGFTDRYAWIQTMTDSTLSDKLSKLSDADKELLTLFVYDGYTQTEIAVLQGCSQQAISKRLTRIKLFLK